MTRAVRFRSGVTALAVVLSAARGSGAQEPAATREDVLQLTLQQARERAASSAPAVEQARALERAARADVDAAKANRLPQFDVSASYTRQSNVPEFVVAPSGGPPTFTYPNLPDQYRTRLSGSVPVYTGGRLAALARAAQSEAAAAAGDVVTTGADLDLETTSAYWELVTARHSERVFAESLVAYESHLKDARNREAVGLAARNEVLAVQVERDRAELARLRAANAAEVAEANLRRLIGAPATTHIEPAESLAEPAPAPDAPASHEPSAIEPLVQEALGRRSERRALHERIAAAEARERAEKATRLPQLSVSGGYDYSNPNYRIFPPSAEWNDSWDVGLRLSWTAFDSGRRGAAIARAQARTDALRQQMEDLDRRVRLQVTQRALDVSAALEAVKVAERNVEAARENARVASERHQAGVIPSSERLDAEVLQLQAGLDHTQALAQLRTARAALDRALGRQP